MAHLTISHGHSTVAGYHFNYIFTIINKSQMSFRNYFK